MSVLWKNVPSTKLQRGPGDRIKHGKNFSEKTIELNGRWDTIEGKVPNNGEEVVGFPGYLVIDAEAVKQPGGGGKLTVHLRKEGSVAAENDENVIITEKLSVRWVKSQRSLFDSSYFVAGSGTDAKLSQIECWKREKDPVLREAFKFKAPVLYGSTQVVVEVFTITDEKTLKLAKKIQKGMTGYWWWYPCVRRRCLYKYPKKFDLDLPTILTAADLQTRVGADKVIKLPNNTTKKVSKFIPLQGKEKDVNGTLTAFDYSYILSGLDEDESDEGTAYTEEWIGAQEWDEDYYK